MSGRKVWVPLAHPDDAVRPAVPSISTASFRTCSSHTRVRQSHRMRLDGPLPFHGYVVCLTRVQGGRDSGPPLTPIEHDYAATGFVPPATVDSGLASAVLRVRDRTAWRSEADAQWLVVDNIPPHRVSEGD